MKKYINKFTLTALLSLCLLVTVAFASEDARISSMASTSTLKAGDTVDITVSVIDSSSIKSMALTPVYDKDVFTLVSGEWLLTDASISDVDMDKGNSVLAYSSAEDPNGDIFTYSLKVKEGADVGDQTISTKAVLKNGTTTIASTSIGSTVTIQDNTQSPQVITVFPDSLTTEKSGDDLRVTVSAQDVVAGNTYTLFVGCYQENGKMIGLKATPVTFAGAGQEKTISVVVNGASSADYVKVFFVDEGFSPKSLLLNKNLQ